MTAEAQPVHPARLPLEQLLAECDIRRLKRSGPGGQHRNKVETAVVITHRPTGTTAEANERRSQSENHRQAVFRLRKRLALEVRTDQGESPDRNLPEPSLLWRSRCVNRRIAIREDHADFPALLAEVLDLWVQSGKDIKLAADHLDCTVSQLVKFLKIEPRALGLINTDRQSQGLAALK